MRMTFERMREVAKDILAVYAYQIDALKKSKQKTAESRFVLEDMQNERNSMESAFAVIGLVSDEDAAKIAKKRWTKKEITAFQDSALWHCAMAKTAKPVSFNPIFDHDKVK